MKLTYWYAERLDDTDAYAIRQKTRKAALAEKATMPEEWGDVVKVMVEYDDAFDLVERCCGEGRCYWEA